jgi:hypothetical protein
VILVFYLALLCQSSCSIGTVDDSVLGVVMSTGNYGRFEVSSCHLQSRIAVRGLLGPEDDGSMIIRNVGKYLPVDTA